MATPDLTLVSEATLDPKLDSTLTSAKGYADTKKNEAIADATTKYGGLPQRMTAVEQKNTAQDQAIIDATWYQGGMTTDTPVNGPVGSIKDGGWRVTSDATAAALGLPFGRAGEFQQVSYGTFGFQSHKTLLGEEVRLWSHDTQTWGAWTNPEKAYTDTQAESVKWRQGGMLATAQINGPLGAVKDGEHWAPSDTRAVELNLPDNRAGKITQVSSGTFGIHVYDSILGTSVRLWSPGTNTWGAWSNPANKYADAAVAAVKWYQGGLTATTPINGPLGGVPDGEWRVTSDGRAVELGLPSGRAGDFKQVSYGTFGIHIYETLTGSFKRLWSNDSQTWGAWTNPANDYTDAAVAAALGEAKSYADEANKPSSGNKLVPLILTAGHGGQSYGMTTGTVRHPMWWGAPIFRARVHIRNINPRENQVRTGAVNFPQGLYIGDATTWDGTATNLRQIAAPFTTPENGDDWVSDWFDFDAAADSKHVLSAAFTATGTVVANAGACWTSPGSVADSTAGTWTQANMSPFDIWIEAETPATTPTVAMVSDSTGAGSGATLPVLDSVLSQHMRAWGGLPIHYTHVGDSFHSYNGGGAAGSEDYKKNRWLHLARPDSAVLGLGNNDTFGASQASLATLQSRYAQTVDWIQQALSPALFLATVTPRDTETGTQEDVRRSYNAWLKEQNKPGGAARGVFDFAATVSSDNETIDEPYNADGIHLTTAGYAAEAAILKNLTSPAVMYRAVV